MKEELRTDSDPTAWRIWSTAHREPALWQATSASSTLRVSW